MRVVRVVEQEDWAHTLMYPVELEEIYWFLQVEGFCTY